MAKKKKKIKPYVTSNPNDPRIQAYRDSLALYNNSQALQAELDKYGYVPAYNSIRGGHIGDTTTRRSTAYRKNEWKRLTKEGNVGNEIKRLAARNDAFDLKGEDNNMFSVVDIFPRAINKNFKVRNLISPTIAPMAKRYYKDTNDKAIGTNEDYTYNLGSYI